LEWIFLPIVKYKYSIKRGKSLGGPGFIGAENEREYLLPDFSHKNSYIIRANRT